MNVSYSIDDNGLVELSKVLYRTAVIAGYGRVRRVSADGTITTVAGNGK
jgi:hypothetical protein